MKPRFDITDFALAQWDRASLGTFMEGISPSELVAQCEIKDDALVDGYAPFCKHLFLPNETPTRCGFAPITQSNAVSLRTGYRARQDGELPVMERWFEGIEAPRALWLDVIFYTHAQLLSEAELMPQAQAVPDCEWGIVSVIGILEPVEPPLPPMTQLRNALGREEGGSGVPIDRAAYARAVAFWERHAVVVPADT